MKLLVDNEAPHTPHNMISLFGSQCGSLAFLNAAALLLLPLIFLFRRLRKEPPRPGDILPFALFCSIAAASADFMFEITYESPAFLCTYAIVVLLAFQRESPSAKAEPSGGAADRSARRTLVLRFGLAAFALLSAAASFLMMRSEQAFAEFQEALDPRYSRTYMADPGSFRPPSHDKVIRLLKRAVSRGPYNPFPWATAAGYMAHLHDYVAAEQFIDEAIRRSPQRSSFYLRRAKIRHAAKADPALVKADLDKTRELFPMSRMYRDDTDDRLLQR